ncbi:hypothetical protein GQX74_005901 [Glossina fuscipes]|nr:hypothetical protein GQX74_005901 [Glossina fuscipes]
MSPFTDCFNSYNPVVGLGVISKPKPNDTVSERPGYGKASSQLLKQCGMEMSPFLVNISNKMIMTAECPRIFKFSSKEKCNTDDAISNVIRYIYYGLGEAFN